MIIFSTVIPLFSYYSSDFSFKSFSSLPNLSSPLLFGFLCLFFSLFNKPTSLVSNHESYVPQTNPLTYLPDPHHRAANLLDIPQSPT